MPTYRSIAESETDPEASLNSDLFKALVGNPLAQFEGDANAPVNQGNWHPYNKVTNGDSNTGRIWSFAVDGALAIVTTPDYADGYDYAFLFDRVTSSNVGAAHSFQSNHYRETGAAYAGVGGIMTQSAVNTHLTGIVRVMDVRLTRAAHIVDTVYSSSANTLSNSSTGVIYRGGVNVTHATPQKILRTQFSWSTGNITGTNAAIYMLRRRLLSS